MQKTIVKLTSLFFIFTFFFTAVAISFAEPVTPPLDLKQRSQSFKLPNDMKISVWADQTLTQNPSYFSFDSRGRLLVAEIFRIQAGVLEVRRFPKAATIDDIKIKTLADRTVLYQKHQATIGKYTSSTISDKIKLIEDTNNDGVADKSTVYAEGFNNLLDGPGSGVIERNGKVYFTNIPNLWQLEDTNNDGVADQRIVLQSGFGTRVSFMGHDLHGLAWGPDGRLYWSLGDRGYHLETKEGKTFSGPNTGAVFRSSPDGSNLEVFYTGLRNPQELVFDEYGNLFTADNDGDKGDTERVNHIIEGGDSGWHAGHQTIMSFSKRLGLRTYKYTGNAEMPVSWLANEMSVPRHKYQPAFMLPGIGQLFMGPSGFTYNPSNYLGDKWRNSFFIAHYGGSPTASHITTFKNKAHGASFLTGKINKIISGMNVADITFGPDGRFYISEFNFGGWESSNEGAIYVLESKNPSAELTARQAKFNVILTSDFSKKPVTELIQLLSKDHQNIRQKAQFALADRGKVAIEVFKRIAMNKQANHFARIHSIWGLSQLVLNQHMSAAKLGLLLPLLADDDDQIRIQTVRVLSDHASEYAPKTIVTALTHALADKHPQAAMYAAIGLGKAKAVSAVPSIIKKLQTVADKDLWLRHGLVMALVGINKQHWWQYRNSQHKFVRLAVLLALRQLNDADVAYFLNDQEYTLVREAIVAIDDKNLVSVRAKVAAKLNSNMPAANLSEQYLHHRMINANFNEGKLAQAERLLQYAGQANLPDNLAAEALAAIEGWNDVNPIDNVTGLASLANMQRDDITALIHQYLPKVLVNAKDKGLVQAMRIASKNKVEMSATLLTEIAQSKQGNHTIRTQALASLVERTGKQVLPIARSLINDSQQPVIHAALALLLRYDANAGTKVLVEFLKTNHVAKNQIALLLIAEQKSALANTESIQTLLANKLTVLLSGTANKLAEQNTNAYTLELIQAAEQSRTAKVAILLKQYQEHITAAPLITQYQSALMGGNAENGAKIFYGGGAAQCIRCHRVGHKGGRVGPNLSNIGKKYQTDYLLESLIAPSAAIAPKFASMTLTLKNNKVVSGLILKETEKAITLQGKKGKESFQKSTIINIQRPISGMPPMGYLLSKTEVRDVVAFLQTLTGKEQAAGH